MYDPNDEANHRVAFHWMKEISEKGQSHGNSDSNTKLKPFFSCREAKHVSKASETDALPSWLVN